jgi:hypothetical protein
LGIALSSVPLSLCIHCSHPPAAKIETMIEHRVRTLFALLPIALATGYSEIQPDLEPLKVPWLIDPNLEQSF